MNGKRPGGWVALAWRYYRDPRFDDVSGDAELLWSHALAYCGEQETDGHVARTALVALSQRLVGSPTAAAVELVAVGLWHETDRGYLVNGWDRWQVTAEQARAGREREVKRKARTRANADTAGDTPGDNQGESPGGVPGGVTPRRGRGRGRGSTSTDAPDPCPPGRERVSEPSEGQGQGPTRPRWEEFTDADGNLFVRPSPNGAADPDDAA